MPIFVADDFSFIAQRMRELEQEKKVFDDFVCHVCGAETASAPPLPDRSICPECCDKSEHGHDYIYDRWTGHYCDHCGAAPPDDWHDPG